LGEPFDANARQHVVDVLRHGVPARHSADEVPLWLMIDDILEDLRQIVARHLVHMRKALAGLPTVDDRVVLPTTSSPDKFIDLTILFRWLASLLRAGKMSFLDLQFFKKRLMLIVRPLEHSAADTEFE
jgi:hypothetical protein